VTGATQATAEARRKPDPGQDRRLQAYLARHTEFSPAPDGQPGVQVIVGGCRTIIHYSLSRLLDDLEDAERATIGAIREVTENSGGAR
jgi:hypothetical protein